MIAPVRTRLLMTVAGVAAIAATLTGCGGDDDSGTSPSTSASSEVKEITLTITDDKVDPQLGDVEVSAGEQVKLTVTSDVADEIHAHTGGDGVELELKPNEAATMTLTAPTVPGVYEVETHESGLLLFELVVK